MNERQITEVLEGVARQYPEELVAGQLQDVPRIAFNIGLVLSTTRRGSERDLAICDLGGGIGLFSVGCAALGFGRVVVVDDFSDPASIRIGDRVFAVHQKYGVEVVRRDIVVDGIRDLRGGFNAVTSFDSIEHWHSSPKAVLHDAVIALKEGGVLVLGVPNCVNLRKRLSVPFGFGKWSSMDEWYEGDRFRGHVREPDTEDLRYIASDLKLKRPRVVGRNWLGYQSRRLAIRLLTTAFDYPLRLFPSLCADIYLVGHK